MREGTAHFLTAALAPRLNVHALPHPPEPSQTSSCDPVAYCLVSVYPDRPATRTVLVPEEEEKEPCPGRRALKEVMEGEVKRTHILKAIKLGGCILSSGACSSLENSVARTCIPSLIFKHTVFVHTLIPPPNMESVLTQPCVSSPVVARGSRLRLGAFVTLLCRLVAAARCHPSPELVLTA